MLLATHGLIKQIDALAWIDGPPTSATTRHKASHRAPSSSCRAIRRRPLRQTSSSPSSCTTTALQLFQVYRFIDKNINNNDWAQISMKPIIELLLTDVGCEIRSNFIYKSFCSFGWLQCCVSVAPLTFFCSFLSQAFSRTTKLAISTPSRWIRQWFILMNDWHFLQLAS